MGVNRMKIGEVATNAGVNIQTVRFYERHGLLPEPPRMPSGYRVYGNVTAEQIRFIKRAQSAGFTLSEIRRLMRVRNGRSDNFSELRAIAKTKIEALDDQIRSLNKNRQDLIALLGECRCSDEGIDCEVIIAH